MARPPYKPTPALRRKVAIAAGGGMSHEEIAIGLGISRTTLLKHFETELTTGAYQKRLEVMGAMHKAAMAGNVAAQKAYSAMTPRVAAPPPPPAELPSASSAQPEGKKAQQHAEAVAAATGTEWEQLLTPRAPVQ
jgi:hypothetical protein